MWACATRLLIEMLLPVTAPPLTLMPPEVSPASMYPDRLTSAERPFDGPLPQTDPEMKQSVPETSRRVGDDGVKVRE